MRVRSQKLVALGFGRRTAPAVAMRFNRSRAAGAADASADGSALASTHDNSNTNNTNDDDNDVDDERHDEIASDNASRRKHRRRSASAATQLRFGITVRDERDFDRCCVQQDRARDRDVVRDRT
jgi:hypothetical protein